MNIKFIDEHGYEVSFREAVIKSLRGDNFDIVVMGINEPVSSLDEDERESFYDTISSLQFDKDHVQKEKERLEEKLEELETQLSIVNLLLKQEYDKARKIMAENRDLKRQNRDLLEETMDLKWKLSE